MKLNDVKLLDITPSSIAADRNIQALAEVFDVVMETYIQTDVLQIMTRINALEGSVLDVIAWQLHVDGYDETDIDEIKRKMILGSLEVHRHKGTPWAVSQAVSSVFQSASVEEWYAYDGSPYHFKISNITERLLNPNDIDRLVSLINDAKNTRSWLDGIEFYNYSNSTEYIGAWVEIKETIDIVSDMSSIERYTLQEYLGSYMEDYGSIDISVKGE